MIVLNPMGGSNLRVVEANGLKDYEVNYNFASALGTYLQQRGEPFVCTRLTSEYPDELVINRFMANYAPDVIINIKCLDDIGSEPSGYMVECDTYSALAATISAEINKWGAHPIYPIGYKVTPFRSVAKYTEITVALGFITNAEDAARMGNAAMLDTLAHAIVDAAYGPPTKVMQPKDDVLTEDPYFYTLDKWLEHTPSKMTGDSGQIIDITIENIPSRVLRLISSKQDAGRVRPYTWYTHLKRPPNPREHVVIVSVKVIRGIGECYLKVGSTEKRQTFTDSSWHKITFDATVGAAEDFFIGISDDTEVYYTAAWVTPKGSVGKLDDPLTQYSIFPPGYRPISQIDPTAIDRNLIPAVVTKANTLMARALDTKLPDINAGIQEVLSKLDQLAIKPTAFINAVQEITNQFNSLDLEQIKLIDPTSIRVDYAMLENMVKSMARTDKRAAMLKGINDIKGVEQAIKTITTTYEQKLNEAKRRADIIQKRIEAKGEAMGKQ